MIESLEITNGNLELKFNLYTYEYTVVVEDEIEALEFEYKLKDDCYVRLRDNYLDEEENIVYLDVFNVDEKETYTFYVYKENTNEVIGIDNYKKALEVSIDNEVEFYKVQILTTGIFLLIVIVFSIIFRRKKSIKQK